MRVLVTGITGQDGSYLAEQLLAAGDEVHGLVRRSSSINTARLDGVYQDPHEDNPRLHLHYGDVLDQASLIRILQAVQPDEVYHLAAQSHVRVSFDEPVYSADVAGLGTARLLEAIRLLDMSPRIYIAGSSEVFGDAPAPQDETTPFRPRSPYAAAKAYAIHIARVYRESYGMRIVVGILFNHESERRGETFVSRKITRAVARIAAGKQQHLYLGNLDARRDWGYAPEYTAAMVELLRYPPGGGMGDYVIGTGESHSVAEFVERAFAMVLLDWKDHVRHDPRYVRPAEVPELRANAARAAAIGWCPRVRFGALVERMVRHDVAIEHGERVEDHK